MTMKPYRAIREPMIQRLSLFFVLLGLIPILLTIAMPVWYFTAIKTDLVAESMLLVWTVQGVAFLVVVVFGALVTLNRLAIPIQELVKGARAITDGDLAYRVPVKQGDRELVTLSETFNGMAAAVETMRDSIEEQRAALEASLNEREREFNVIVEIASLANRQADLTSTATQAIRAAHSVFSTDILCLVLLDEARAISSLVFSCKPCPKHAASPCTECPREQLARRILYRMQNTLIQEAANQAQTTMDRRSRIRINDVQADTTLDDGLRSLLDQLEVRMMAVKPLLTRDRVPGVLVLMRHQTVPIPDRTCSLLDTLAENMAILLENWHLQDEVRKLTIMEERRRLASELHDSVTQSLFTLSLTARGLKSSLADIPAANQQALDMLIAQTRTTQREVRALVNELRPIDLGTEDLESAIRRHVQSFRRLTDIEVSVTLRGNFRRIPKPAQQNLNRITQEALSNITRHAHASHVDLTLETADNTATLTIHDNGSGFDPRAVTMHAAGSLGLISMRERAETLGGALLVRSQPGAGTTITAQIPLSQEWEAVHAR